MKTIFDKNSLVLSLTGVGLLLYFLSFLGYLFPILNTILFFGIFIFVFWLTKKDLQLGVFAVLFEAAIGVKGYLFSFTVFGFPISLRLALFVMVFLVWLYAVYRKKIDVEFVRSKAFLPFALFTIILLLGMIFGTLNGNDIKNIFFDVNGYFYLAMIFPVYHIFTSQKAKRNALSVLIAGALAITLFSLFTALQFTLFHQDSRPDLAQAISSELAIDEEDEEEVGKISHSVTAKDELADNFSFTRTFENKKPPIYRWTQDVSVAEISYLAGPFFRVFSPGQVFSLLLFVFALFVVFTDKLKKPFEKTIIPELSKKTYVAFGAISLFTVILGFSRSLWLGLLASLIIFALMLPVKRALILASVSLTAVFVLGFGLNAFAPDAFQLIEKRISSIVNPSSESAGSNRVNVLGPALDIVAKNPLLGTGFGTTVEYESVVPEKYGTLRVFAFEWSYIDMLTEVGVVGLLSYFYFIYALYKHLGLRKIILFQAIILALIITNIATPYLNHPLGISILLVSAGLTRKTDE
jgi:hypothetical protein